MRLTVRVVPLLSPKRGRFPDLDKALHDFSLEYDRSGSINTKHRKLAQCFVEPFKPLKCSPEQPRLVKKVYDQDMVSLLQLLVSREGTAKAVAAALEDGVSISEVHPRTKEGVLHVLFRRCVLPLELYETVRVLVDGGADVNLLDYRGATPLSILVLHINHGLRYHSYPLPEIQRLEDLAAHKTEIQDTMAALDAKYQDQVFKSLELLLQVGAKVNTIPDVVPALPAYTEWVEAYEHKLMQQEGRWHLLGYDTSMEFSTYNIFNPVCSHRCLNEQKLTPLHLAAWRGDYKCIRLLLDHGADAKAITDENRGASKESQHSNSDRNYSQKLTASGDSQHQRNNKVNARPKHGRGVLHFLYLYCNKPSDLVKTTRALLAAGADPNVSHFGEYPAHYLIPHVFVKRTYHQYLSNTFHLEELRRGPGGDNYVQELSTCLTLLSDAGMSRGPAWDSLLLKLFTQFEHVFTNTDKMFQPQGHYLVPYTFRLDSLTWFAGFLIGQGCKVNICDTEGQTPLHHLVSTMHNISTDPRLNSSSAICECFKTLLDAGADCNKKDIYKKTPVFAMVLVILETINYSGSERFEVFLQVLNLITWYGGDLNVRDCLEATPLSRAVAAMEKPLHCRTTRRNIGGNMKRLLETLLMNGADPNAPWTLSENGPSYLHPSDIVFALDNLFDLHFGLQLHESGPDPYCVLSDVISMFCVCMKQSSLYIVLRRIWAKTYPTLTEAESLETAGCADCALVTEYSRTPFTLKVACRQTLIRAVPGRYTLAVPLLPLPGEIKRYLLDLCAV